MGVFRPDPDLIVTIPFPYPCVKNTVRKCSQCQAAVLHEPLYTTGSTPKGKTDKVSNYIVYTVEHFAAEEPDIFIRGWCRLNQSLKESKFDLLFPVDRNKTPNE